jgi:hypothetical protein
MTQRIALSGKRGAGLAALVDDADAAAAEGYSWHLYTSGGSGSRKINYARAYVRGSGKAGQLYVTLHGLLAGCQIDHVNGDGLDCRRVNMRPATPGQNSHNTRPHTGSSSRFKGVALQGGRWRAQITTAGQRHYLGFFDDEETAARAYDAAALAQRGPHAWLNFPAH